MSTFDPSQDSAVGYDRAPTRYTDDDGRELVDTMRDEAHAFADAVIEQVASDPDPRYLADILFAFAARTHARTYLARRDKKGTPEQDDQKARWWAQMEAHALLHKHDPRSSRPSFQPYLLRRVVWRGPLHSTHPELAAPLFPVKAPAEAPVEAPAEAPAAVRTDEPAPTRPLSSAIIAAALSPSAGEDDINAPARPTRFITTHYDGCGLTERCLVAAMDEPHPVNGAHHEYLLWRSLEGNEIHPDVRDECPDGYDKTVGYVHFQNGPRNVEGSVPGTLDSALLAIVRDRLESFQAGPFACDENAGALRFIEEAMDAFKRRAQARAARGVLGTNAR